METRAANTQSDDDKTLEKLMDEHLKANGLYRRKIAKDGSCLFRAVAEQVLHCQGLHTKVRAECVKYLRKHRELYESFIEGDFDEYLQRLQDPQCWVGQVEISALAVLYEHDFVIYQQPGEPPVNITENGFSDKVRLCFLNGNHYDSVYPQSFAQNAAMCQSILYELLYERVCGVERGAIAPSLRTPKSEEEFAKVEECKSSEESDLDEGEAFWSGKASNRMITVNSRPPNRGRGRGHTRGGGRSNLPLKVQNSLNPQYFRNVEYDVWLRSQRAQQRRDFCMAAGMQYTTGDKCQVRLSNTGPFYSAYIQEVSPDDGPVTVFIEELGERHTVPLWNLRTASEESWRTVSEKGRRQPATHTNGHTNDWDNRGGRKLSRSMSNAKATAASVPNSRVQKQHSWPPQAPSEPQSSGTNATNRSSDQDIGRLCVSPEEEEEHVLLEQLQKDENNFPTLEASAQAAAAEVGRRSEKKGSRRKSDVENKEHIQKSAQSTDKGKQQAKKSSAVQQDQRASSPIRDKPNPCSTSNPTLPAIPAPKTAKTSPAVSEKTSLPAQSTPVQSQTAPAASTKPPAPALTTPAKSQPTKSQEPAEGTPVQMQSAPVSSIKPPKLAECSPVPPKATPDPAPKTPKPAQIVPAQPQIVVSRASTPATASVSSPTQSQIPTISFGTTLLDQATCVPGTSSPAPVSSQNASTQCETSNPVFMKMSPASPPHTSPESQVSGMTLPAPNPALPAGAPVSATSPERYETTSLPPCLTPPAFTSGTTVFPPQTPPPTTAPSQDRSTPVPDSSLIASETSKIPVFTPASQAGTPVTHVTSAGSAPQVPPQTAIDPGHLPVSSSTPATPSNQAVSNTVTIPVFTQQSATPLAPVNMSSVPSPHPSSSSTLAPFQSGGLSAAFHGAQPPYPPYTSHAPPHPPTSGPVPPAQLSLPTPPPVISSTQTLPFSYPSEQRPYEHRVSPVTGVTPTAVSDFGQTATPQHAYPPSMHFPPFHELIQDPLYPGFPKNDKDEVVQIPPPYSLNPNGKDLPKDTSVLRFFFNLGLKAFIHQVLPPATYLSPLTHVYNLQPKIPPPPLPSSYSSPNVTPYNAPNLLMHMSSAPTTMPGGHFELPGAPQGASYGSHPHPPSLQMHHRPPGPWPVASVPNLYPPEVFSAPSSGGQAYPPSILGHPQLPPLPSSYHLDVAAPTVSTRMERSEGDRQLSSTPQLEKQTWFGGGKPHLGGGDVTSSGVTPSVMATAVVDLARGSSSVPGAEPFPTARIPTGVVAESVMLSNGNRGDGVTSTFMVGASLGPPTTMEDWEIEEADFGGTAPRGTRSYYRSSFRQGGRRGQDDRGGYRGRGSRVRREYSGRDRQDGQTFHHKGYGGGRGKGRGYFQHSNIREAGFTPPTET